MSSAERVSVLYREPMWLKWLVALPCATMLQVSVLYREPMWLKCGLLPAPRELKARFSALP